MPTGHIPGLLGYLAGERLSPHAVGAPGSVVVSAFALGTKSRPGGSHAPASSRPHTPSAPRLVSLTITHGAEPTAQPGHWESYLFTGESIIVLAKTEPNNWSTWRQIHWQSTGGKSIAGSGNGFAIPRTEMREFRVSASLGGFASALTVTVTTLVDMTSPGGTGGSLGTPINPIGTGLKINLYGEHDTDKKGFKDYTVIKEYQNPGGPDKPTAARDIRPLTKASLTAPPPDGPGLRDNCASDICIRAAPFYSPTYYAIQRIRSKTRCRITYYTPSGSFIQEFLDAFPDASLLQNGKVDNTPIAVIEYPRKSAWPAASSVPAAVIPKPDLSFYAKPRKTRVTEEDGLT